MKFNDKSLPMENCSDYEKKYRIQNTLIRPLL